MVPASQERETSGSSSMKKLYSLANRRFCALLLGAILGSASTPSLAYQHPLSFVPSEDQALSPSEASLPDGETAAVISTSSGCGKKAAKIGDFSLSTLDGNKKTRHYSLQVPGNYSDTHAYPVVFVFHGAGGSPAQSYSWGLQNVTGAATAAIFVFPAGIQFQNYGVGWNDSKNGYDMAFFDNMLKTIAADYCVNSKRVFATGFSWGGDFVVALTCARGEVLRAASVNSSTDEYKLATDSKTYENSPCPSTVHPAVRFAHAKGGDSEYPAPLFATTSSLYRRFNVCSTTAAAVASSSSAMSCVSYNSCTKQFVECTFAANLGHTLPPNWAKDTWSYFSTFQ